MRKITRRNFLASSVSVGTALYAGALSAQSRQSDEEAYNVVLLMADEHNPRYSSVYGHPALPTPNLERLAREGVVFERAYCPSPLCMPSRSAFMSGQRVHAIQCYSNCNVFPKEYIAYGEVLKNQGVHSVHVGKTDVYRPTAELGFSEAILPGDRLPPGDTNISRDPLSIRDDGAQRAKGYGPREDAGKKDTHIVEEALRWIKERGVSCDTPFTIAVNINAPHFPHYASPELWEKFADTAGLPLYGAEQPSANHPYALDLRSHFQTDQFGPEDIEGLRRGYFACVAFVDSLVGRFLDCLDETGLSRKTVFVYTADHGEMLGKFGMWWKCSLYEDSVRVPLLVRGPGFKANHRVATPVDLHDVQAALFEATKTTRPKEWVGTPLQALQEEQPERFVFSEYHGHGVRASGYVITKGDWKLIWCAEAPHLLFNLRDDPEELRDLSRDKKDVFRELETYLYNVCNPLEENARASAYIKRQLAAMNLSSSPSL